MENHRDPKGQTVKATKASQKPANDPGQGCDCFTRIEVIPMNISVRKIVAQLCFRPLTDANRPRFQWKPAVWPNLACSTCVKFVTAPAGARDWRLARLSVPSPSVLSWLGFAGGAPAAKSPSQNSISRIDDGISTRVQAVTCAIRSRLLLSILAS